MDDDTRELPCDNCRGTGWVDTPGPLQNADGPRQPCRICGGRGYTVHTSGCLASLITGLLARLLVWVGIPVLVLLFAIAAYNQFFGDDEPATSGLTAAQAAPEVAYGRYRVGGCVDDPSGAKVVVPCDQAHDTEVFHVAAVAEPADVPYPGRSRLVRFGDEVCLFAFAGYVGTDYGQSVLRVRHFTPTEEDWGEGIRDVACMAEDPNGPLTGSVRGSAR